MGAVYEAKHRGTGRRVAIKLILADGGLDEPMIARFQREARAAVERRARRFSALEGNISDPIGDEKCGDLAAKRASLRRSVGRARRTAQKYPDLDHADRAFAEREIEELRSQAGLVALTNAEPGAQIVIDARARGTYPTGPLRVSAGTHVVRVYKVPMIGARYQF